jgi:hypothetical protein
MTTRVQCGVTAGLAIVGASVVAVAPLTLPMPPASTPTGAGATANNRPIGTTVKAINNQLKQSAERLDRTVKEITGTDQKKANAGADAAADDNG